MSFNRGMKRDSFGNRGNFNRSGGGGGGGGNRGNNNMGNSGMGNNMGGGMGGSGGMSGMNPWEGGMMPGGRGILPTPNNNLSLTSQTQLALASNLLTNLLRTHTQEVQPQVPSLMSLGNNYSGSGPNYSNQQNYSSGRFNDRPVRHLMKNQRPHPYNKMGNRARDGPAGRRGPTAQTRSPQSGSQRMNGNQIDHRTDKSSKPIPASKQNQTTTKKEQQDVKTDSEKAEPSVSKREDSVDAEEKKRDRKEEKKEVQEEEEGEEATSSKVENEETEDETKEEKSVSAGESPSKDGKDGSQKSEKESAKAAGKKSEARHAESRYAEVPMSHMFCHICNKHMWDGFSFENHIRGRVHQLMMEKLDESYKLKVDLMRHELRVAEEQRELSLNNSKRRGKKVPVDLNVREYCTMCDLNFYGSLSTHRKSEKHQQLKTFLHPRCFPCLKEFPSRIEYDEHCLTPSHMKNVVQCEEQRKNKKKEKLAKGEAEVRTAEDEEKDVQDGKNEKAEKEEDSKEQEYITDITENMNDKGKIPTYKYCRQNQILIGKSMVKEVQGYYCERCRRFMLLAEDMNAHLRSITHYRNFVTEVKSLVANTEKDNDQTSKNEKSAEDDTEDNDEHEGDRKRRKLNDDDDETERDDNEVNDSQESNAENADGAAQKKPDGEEKYDPLEADAAESEEDDSQQFSGTAAKEEPEIIDTEVSTNAQEVKKETKETKEETWTDTLAYPSDNDAEASNAADKAEEKPPVKIEQNHSPQVMRAATPRGRGFMRGRGGNQRARKSRR